MPAPTWESSVVLVIALAVTASLRPKKRRKLIGKLEKMAEDWENLPNVVEFEAPRSIEDVREAKRMAAGFLKSLAGILRATFEG